MDISTAPGPSDALGTETSASPIDPALTGAGKGKRRADDDDGEGDDGSAATKKRRNRKPVTCAQCRRRKLKCDRGFPCGACRDRQEGHLCEWEGAIRLPQAHLTRDAEAQELRLQLDRLDTLLGHLYKHPAAAAAGLAPGLPGSTSEVAEESAAEALGLLADAPRTRAASQQRGRQLDSNSAVTQLVAILPPKPELESYIDRFVATDFLFFPVAHLPGFKDQFSKVSANRMAEKPFYAALLMAIIAHECGRQAGDMSLRETVGEERDRMSKRFFDASLDVLRFAGYLERPDLDVVRALLVLYRAAAAALDLRAASLLAQAIQCGQALGLHREPDAVPSFSLIDVEDRRRLWYLLLVHDKLDQTRRTSLISSSSYDTREPTSAYDKDITETEVTAQPFPAFTPVLYLGVQTQFAALAHSINETVYAPKGAALLPVKYLQDQNAALERIKKGLPALQWSNDAAIPLGPDNLSSDRFRILAHLLALNLIIRLNRCFLTRGHADPRHDAYRQKCLLAAQESIGLWQGYDDKHALSSIPSLLHSALNGAVLVAIDLFQDPHGIHAEKNRRMLARAVSRLSTGDRPRVVAECLRVIAALDKVTPKTPGQQLPRPTVPANLSTALGPAPTSLKRPLPVSLTGDAFGLQRLTGLAKVQPTDLSTIWRGLIQDFPAIHAVPDVREWTELLKVARGESDFWEDGLDILV